MRSLDEPEQCEPRALAAPRAGTNLDVQWARIALEGALEDAPMVWDPPLEPHTIFGGYELLEELGRGATGIVYRCRPLGGTETVAIKLMLGSEFASEAEVQRFRFGAETAAELDHPNIVPVLQVDEHEGRPFFTMRLLEGGSLALALRRLRSSQLSAACLIAKVARAVHHAHERGVLHRDLKPENIVLDEHDEPYVADFGLAKRLDQRTNDSKSSAIVGSADYMAPEQASGTSRTLTFAADIYSLGAIFYELLTGELPVQGASLAEMLERLRSPVPVRAPRELDSCVDRELELVCLKCLEKDPAQRYASAAELALDLERWLRFEPVTVTPHGRAAELWRWCRRHPVVVTVLSGALCVAVATTVVGLSIVREQEEALRREVLHVNSYAAQAKAGQVLVQLRELSHPVARCAADPRVIARVAPGSIPDGPSLNTDRLLIECGAGALYDSITLLDRDGMLLARFPRSQVEIPGRDLSSRDYFAGTKRLGSGGYRSVHVARVHRSRQTGQLAVALATPVFDDENRWIGVVSAHVDMNAFLESLRLRDDGRQLAVLAGVRDREPDEAGTSPQDAMILLHEKLASGPSVPIVDRWLMALSRFKGQAHLFGGDPFHFPEPDRALEDDYRTDPGAGERWLAGFAPVGDTGYAVIVQTRYEAALEVPQRAFVSVLGGSALVLAFGTALVLLVALLLRTRLRS
jgi:hypothetical protein